jgi:hypothetical protein
LQSLNNKTGRINHEDQGGISREDLIKLLPRMHHPTQRQKNLILLLLPIHPETQKLLLQHQEDQEGIGGVFPPKRTINYFLLTKSQPALNRAVFFNTCF